MKSVKELVLHHGSLMMALPWIRAEGHKAEVVQALSEAVEAQSELQASRSRQGRNSKSKKIDDRRALMTKMIKEGYQVKAVAEAAGVTPMTVYRHIKSPEMMAWFRQPGNLIDFAELTDPNPVAPTKEDYPDGFFESKDDKKPSRRKK